MRIDKSLHPRPQFCRDEWMSLDGIWTCHIPRRPMCYRRRRPDSEIVLSKGFEDEIRVPFAPGTPASGLPVKEIVDTIYYHRKLSSPEQWAGRRLLLHFGAVFYHAEVFIDGQPVGFHDGGSSSFCLDVTEPLGDCREHDLVVKATANLQDGSIPSGKQSSYVSSYGCYYQRTTGIWQTVWLEPVSQTSLDSIHMVWSEAASSIILTPRFRGPLEGGMRFEVEVGNACPPVSCPACDGQNLVIRIAKPRFWWPGKPYLYDITLKLKDADGGLLDNVSSYFGLRTVEIHDGFVYINSRKLYQRLVLDQGFYPEGNWTSPSDAALERDIRLSMSAGFNGARLHQKVFEEKFLYQADRLGYIVWAESPSWGLDYNDAGLPARNFLCEWREIVERDRNHPSIITWTPLNETWDVEDALAHRRLHRDAYLLTKDLDPTRPVNDASGYIHFVTDLWTVHDYEQDPPRLAQQLAGRYVRFPDYEKPEPGQPYLIDEFGGIRWDPKALRDRDNLSSWGYGNSPAGVEEYFERLRGLVDSVLANPDICGYCYTQLTDVEQEKNGVYYYDRRRKFDSKRFRAIFSRKPEGFI